MPKSYIIEFQYINKTVIVRKRTMTIQIRTNSGFFFNPFEKNGKSQ